MSNCDAVMGQLNAIMEALTKSAVVEISKLFHEIIVALRLEIYESRCENQKLKRKLVGMHSELKTEAAEMEEGPPMIQEERCEEDWGASDPHTQRDSCTERGAAEDLGCSHWMSTPADAQPRPAGAAGELSEDDEWGGDTDDSHGSDTTGKDSESLALPPRLQRWPCEEQDRAPAGQDRAPEEQDRAPFSCAQCGKRFSRQDYLKVHQRCHTGDKPFPCSQCQKSFACRHHLKQHLLIHSGLKPFSCTTCGRDFSRKYHLQEHQKTHTDTKTHICAVCGKRFKQYGTLKTHLRSHNGKTFSCVCGKSFNTKYVLKQHQMIHTGERPYSCEQCGKRFTRRSSLKKHMEMHYGGIDTAASFL
ncbi:hypothetical protein SKAU_G00421670 [Synaphobranchus kaupii]|uniref:C2H2-type domain-containing protein n=1 Tax=Synaphobranchus kaupii TaxID=118154 RepID=A0A9Q1IB70_SYNKA|nr:hypothetical protein SKAU_G00421670 [Synaphobranchus kaupii]